MLGCGACADCRGGRQHVCADRREVGVTDGWPGMLAEYALIPTRFAHYVPDAVSATAAALVEPGANALRAVRAAAVDPASRLLIMGDGTIGLLATLFAVDAGAEVTVCGLRPDRLALAGRLGARHTVSVDGSGRADRRPRTTPCWTPPPTRRRRPPHCRWSGPAGGWR